MWMMTEVVVFAVLQNKQTILFQKSLFKNQIRYLWNLLQRVRRVSKDKVILLVAGFQEFKDVCSQRNTVFVAQFPGAFADEAMVVAVHLDAYHLLATTRHEFQRYAACTREEVKRGGIFQVHILNQHVKDIFLGKIRGRPRLK